VCPGKGLAMGDQYKISSFIKNMKKSNKINIPKIPPQ
jgi:hypothetical protein